MNDDTLTAVVALAEAAYRMGAKDARHLCLKEVERIAAGRLIGIDGRVMTGYVATTVKEFVEAIRAIEPARAMPCFTGAALVALGAPTSDAEVCAECGGTVELDRAGTGWPTCGCVPSDVPSDVHEHGWQWRPTDKDTAFAPPFGTIRVCRGCGCLVSGGPTACWRCVAAEERKP